MATFFDMVLSRHALAGGAAEVVIAMTIPGHCWLATSSWSVSKPECILPDLDVPRNTSDDARRVVGERHYSSLRE
jgi:hypothetical protein